MEVSGQRPGGTGKDTITKASDEDGDVSCQPCYSDGDWVIAVGFCQNCNEFMCVTCLKVHRKQAMSRNHAIAEGEQMPKSQTLSEAFDVCSELCSAHDNEIIKFYCPCHDVVGCGDCMVLDHKSCKVERIQDISRKYYNGLEHKHLLQTVEKFEKDFEQIENEIQTNEQKVDTFYSKAVDQIKQFRKRINYHFDEMESVIIAELDKRKEHDKKAIKEVKDKKNVAECETEALRQKLILQVSKANELFVTATRMKKGLSGFENQIKRLKELNYVMEYEFEESSKLEEILSTKAPLGKLIENSNASLPRKNVADMEPEFVGDINMRSGEDNTDCNIIATALVTPAIIAVADRDNKCVKMIDTDKKKIIGRHKFNCHPLDIAVIGENEIAVTLPDEKKVVILFISEQNRLYIDRTLKTNGMCKQIAYKNGIIALSYYSSNKVDILTDKGSVIKSIPSTNSPEALAFAHGSEAVLVNSSETVTKYDVDGNVIAVYKDIDLSPHGMTVLQDDTVVVGNWFSKWKIIFFSPKLEKLKEMLHDNKHVHYPYCVSFSEESKKLFVCNNVLMHNFQLKNTMKVFQLK